MLDDELFLRPQYVLHGETQSVSVIMISHGNRLCKNVDLRVKCLLHLTDFNQNRNVQASFNKSLNMNFHVKFSGGRQFFSMRSDRRDEANRLFSHLFFECA